MARISMTPPLVRLMRFTLVVCIIVAFVIAIMPGGSGPGGLNDKQLHALTFFGLGGLTGAGFRKRGMVPLFLALTFLGGLIEIAQWATDWGRSAEWADLFADMIGASVGLIASRIMTRKPRPVVDGTVSA
ncbi:VanZ family protein [Alteriqipengyuania sp. 357]